MKTADASRVDRVRLRRPSAWVRQLSWVNSLLVDRWDESGLGLEASTLEVESVAAGREIVADLSPAGFPTGTPTRSKTQLTGGQRRGQPCEK